MFISYHQRRRPKRSLGQSWLRLLDTMRYGKGKEKGEEIIRNDFVLLDNQMRKSIVDLFQEIDWEAFLPCHSYEGARTRFGRETFSIVSSCKNVIIKPYFKPLAHYSMSLDAWQVLSEYLNASPSSPSLVVFAEPRLSQF